MPARQSAAAQPPKPTGPLAARARTALKHTAGALAAATLPQCSWDRAVFLFGHMRCGSTALSNILCSRPEISGYGEAHVAYADRSALGRLAVNQRRRGAFRPASRHLFDKVLHSRYDAAPHPGLLRACALFLVRAPLPSILSIRTLFARLGSNEYPTDEAAAAYYEERLARLAHLWAAFPQHRRLGTSYEELTAGPDPFLARTSALLGLAPPLANHYTTPATVARGAGDPLSSHRFDSIVGGGRSSTLDPAARQPDLAPDRLDHLQHCYEDLRRLFAAG